MQPATIDPIMTISIEIDFLLGWKMFQDFFLILLSSTLEGGMVRFRRHSLISSKKS
jgi:hypothetical protein